MPKVHIFIVSLISIISLPSYCMIAPRHQLKPWAYSPTKEKYTSTTRHLLDAYAHQAPQLNSNIQIIREATPDELENRCDYFAFKQATGFTKPGSFHERVEIIADCFHQTKKPMPNDIVVFTKNTDSLDPLHFAVVKSVTYPKKNSSFSKKPKPELILESKWGEYPHIYQHKPFDVPTCYGTCYGVFTLNDEYKSQ